ncbi:hypothetical protein L0128_14460 [candidate division KSB1 bacterium]|nr:hypothetical protein [candidate division KSB1 bacterium]
MERRGLVWWLVWWGCFLGNGALETGCAQNITLLGRWGAGPCRTVAVQDSLAYIGTGGYLQVVRLDALTKVGEILTPGVVNQIVIVNRLAYIADRQAGLRIYDISQPAKIKPIGFKTGFCNRVVIQENQALVAAGVYGLEIYDISDPTRIAVVSTFKFDGCVDDLAFDGRYVYLACNKAGLKVIDLTDPTQPRLVSELPEIGLAYHIHLFKNYAYLSGSAALQIIDIQNPEKPRKVGVIAESGLPQRMLFSGQYAYLAADYKGLLVFDLTQPAVPVQVASLETENARDLAFADSMVCIADGNAGLRLLKLQNPSEIRPVHKLATTGLCKKVLTLDDYLYAQVWTGDRFQYQIFDLKYPFQPEILGMCEELGENLQIVGKHLYYTLPHVLKVASGPDLLHPQMLDSIRLRHPVNDFFIQDGFVFVYPTTPITDSPGIEIIDCREPQQLRKIGFLPTTESKRVVGKKNHWLFLQNPKQQVEVWDLDESGHPHFVSTLTPDSLRAFYLVRGFGYTITTQEQLRIFDFNDSIHVRYTSPQRNPFDQSPPLVIGDYAYYHTTLGIMAVDITNPAHPLTTGFLGSYGTNFPMAANARFLFLAKNERGIEIVDRANPGQPVEWGNYRTTASPKGIAADARYLYVASDMGGFQILDLHPKSTPPLLGQFFTQGTADQVVVNGRYAFLADASYGLRMLDVNNSAQPRQVGCYCPGTNGTAGGLTCQDTLLFLTGGIYGFQILEVREPAQIIPRGRLGASWNVGDAAVYQHYALLPEGNRGLRIIDIQNLDQPVEVAVFDSPGIASDVVIAGNYAYLADGYSGLRILDIHCPTAPVEVGAFNTGNFLRAVAIRDKYLYLAASYSGLRVLELSNPIQPIEVGHFHFAELEITDVAIFGSNIYGCDPNAGVFLLRNDLGR